MPGFSRPGFSGEDGALQDALYRAARAGDRAAVAAHLKKLILTDDRADDEKSAFAATIDIAAENMATLSLLVLCLQGDATGLFRHLAEKEPAEILRVAPPLVAAFENLLFVRPLAQMGADPSFMNGRLLEKAVASGDLALAGWMLENGADAKSPENARAMAAYEAAVALRQRDAARENLARVRAQAQKSRPSLGG